MSAHHTLFADVGAVHRGVFDARMPPAPQGFIVPGLGDAGDRAYGTK